MTANKLQAYVQIAFFPRFVYPIMVDKYLASMSRVLQGVEL